MMKLKDCSHIINKLVTECCDELDIQRPSIKLINSGEYAQQNKSFAGYVPGENKILVVCKNRNLTDILRSLSHEIYHSYQDQNNMLEVGAGQDGDKFENEANSYSGKVMRRFGRENPEIYNIFL